MCILPARRLPRPWLPARYRMPPSLDVSAKLSRPDREARSGRRLSVLRAWSQGRTCEGEVKARSRRGGDAARSTRHQPPPLLLLFPLDWVFLAPSRRSLGRKRQDVGTAGPPPAYVIQRSHTGAALRPSGRARAGQSPALDALRVSMFPFFFVPRRANRLRLISPTTPTLEPTMGCGCSNGAQAGLDHDPSGAARSGRCEKLCPRGHAQIARSAQH